MFILEISREEAEVEAQAANRMRRARILRRIFWHCIGNE
jgi:hypothetical protein